jgi:hypothetical protein
MADVDGLNVVYGIVTNYNQWNFLRSLNENVDFDETFLLIEHNGPHLDSLRVIVEKIYAMLSDDTEGTETNKNTDDTKDDSA